MKKTKEALVAKRKELKKEGKGNKPNASRMITDEEVDILYGQDLLGCSSSEAFINTMAGLQCHAIKNKNHNHSMN